MIKTEQTSKRSFYYEITTTTGTTRKFTIDNPKEITIDSNNFPSLQDELVSFALILVGGDVMSMSPISEDLTKTGKAGYDQTVNTIKYDNIFNKEIIIP